MGYWLKGVAPRSAAGRSVEFGGQTWEEIWTYCLEVDPDTAGALDEWWSSNGQGLDDEQASILGDALEGRVASGEAAEYLAEITAEDVPCFCEGRTPDCHRCVGTGTAKRAGFDLQALATLAAFLRDCGGFTLH